MLKDVLESWGAVSVSGIAVYSDIFKLGDGYIQKSGEVRNLKANPLGYYKNVGDVHGRYRVFLEDSFEETLVELQEADFAIINGLSYFGKRNKQDSASKMFAMVFDLDGVTDKTLGNFLSGCGVSAYPLPNYIALSGHGIHLYYVFEEPVSLYPNIKLQLKRLKYALTEKIWNQYTSTEKKVQYQGINQGFRPIGGKTKIPGVRVLGYRLNEHPFTIGQLCEYVLDEYRVNEKKLYKESRMTLEEAKVKYPRWYKKRIIDGDKSLGHWNDKRDLYDWWKEQIKGGATYGHRYFTIMCLAIYAVKSGISEEELRRDAYEFMPFLNGLSDVAFTEEDVESALECYDERYYRFPRDDMSRLSGIVIPENKRNYRKQKLHLRLARAAKDILKESGELRGKDGRPSKEVLVKSFLESNVDMSVAEAARRLGVSRGTIYKYKKMM